jgi:hypothetical protein
MMIRASWIACWAAVAVMACGAAAANDFQPAQPCATVDGPPREQRFARFVCVRARAIQTAFGALFDGRALEIRIEFAGADEPQYPQSSMSAYDPQRHTIYFRRAVLSAPIEAWHQWALAYWPYYRNTVVREEFPIIGIIDEALWNAHLREAAHQRGLRWPHEDCGAIDIARRLGCEMLVSATVELSRAQAAPLFNTNRIDRLWPEDVREFERRAWTHEGREYREVRRLGGMLLVEPLIREFGAPRVFSYLASTPFRIETGNVRVAALQYQDRARTALAQ